VNTAGLLNVGAVGSGVADAASGVAGALATDVALASVAVVCGWGRRTPAAGEENDGHDREAVLHGRTVHGTWRHLAQILAVLATSEILREALHLGGAALWLGGVEG
jgi:hypothetical protein